MKYVKTEAKNKSIGLDKYEDEYSQAQFKNYDQLAKNIENAKDFAGFIWERENLPFEVKQKLKKERDNEKLLEYMTTQKPTEKQLNYLLRLGCPIVPENKAEASNLINQYMQTNI